MVRSLILGAFLLTAACSSAEPPLMIDGARSPATDAERPPADKEGSADQEPGSR